MNTQTVGDLTIRPLTEGDLADAERIFRVAFGTYLGLPDPLSFSGDASIVATRWRAAPDAAFGAFHQERLVGSNFLAHWGSFGYFGPLTVDPACWGQRIAQHLLDETLPLFDQWGITHAGLFTFPQSPLHTGLYQKYGFLPGHLTAVMSRPVTTAPSATSLALFAALPAPRRARVLTECRAMTDRILPGLDLSREIMAVLDQDLGDTVLLYTAERLSGFAVCHAGAGSEAGADTVYIKFGAVDPGEDAEAAFVDLLNTCEAYAHQRGMQTLVAGVNTARREAHRLLIERKFKTMLQGLAMQRPDHPAYNRPGCLVLDDWR